MEFETEIPVLLYAYISRHLDWGIYILAIFFSGENLFSFCNAMLLRYEKFIDLRRSFSAIFLHKTCPSFYGQELVSVKGGFSLVANGVYGVTTFIRAFAALSERSAQQLLTIL